METGGSDCSGQNCGLDKLPEPGTCREVAADRIDRTRRGAATCTSSSG